MEIMSKMQAGVMGWQEKVDGKSFGELTGHDIAAALATIKGSDAPSNLMRAKYCDDPREARRLLALINGAIIASTRIDDQFRSNVAMLALQEVIVPNLCRKCGGVGEVMVMALRVQCKACCGSGIGRHSDAHYIDAIGCTREQWRFTIEREFGVLMAIVTEWELRGRAAIIRALKNF